MLSKTSSLEKCILEDIISGRYPAGSLIPSRHRLTARYNCSRTTVERAIADLESQGYLNSRKGSGTYVVHPSRKSKIEEVYIVLCDESGKTPEILFGDDLLDLPVKWLQGRKAAVCMDEITAPGAAVIWNRPNPEMLDLIDYLALKNIPQILLNRHYRNYDCIYTDPRSSLKKGLEWLRKTAGPEIAVIYQRPEISFPYVSDRLLAAYELCFELDLHPVPEFIFSVCFDNSREKIKGLADRLFPSETCPRGILLLHQGSAFPLINYGHQYGRQPGRDYFLLMFDTIPDLMNCSGVAMIRQPLDEFAGLLRTWIGEGFAGNPRKPFCRALTGELIIGDR